MDSTASGERLRRHRGTLDRSWLASSVRAVLVRPSLWVTGLRQVLVLARPGWWRTWPPVPEPPADYLRFRLETAYGGDGAAPVGDDVVTYLRWCRQWRGLLARERRA